MPKTRPFAELAAAVMADPVRRERIAVLKRAMEDALALAAMQDQGRLTPGSVSRLEHEEGLYLATLREYVTDLGGHFGSERGFPGRHGDAGTVRGVIGGGLWVVGHRRPRLLPLSTHDLRLTTSRLTLQPNPRPGDLLQFIGVQRGVGLAEQGQRGRWRLLGNDGAEPASYQSALIDPGDPLIIDRCAPLG